MGTPASSWPGNLVSQYGSRLRVIPVSEATDSASANSPQLHDGLGWPSSSRPSIGIGMCPSSPAIPAAPLTTRPSWTTPPPSPVPTIADTELRRPDSGPCRTWWA